MWCLQFILLALLALSTRVHSSQWTESSDDESIAYLHFHVESLIVARYAKTLVTSVVVNRASVSQNVSFRKQVPEAAFISNFTMCVSV